jgi:hypothetical protein
MPQRRLSLESEYEGSVIDSIVRGRCQGALADSRPVWTHSDRFGPVLPGRCLNQPYVLPPTASLFQAVATIQQCLFRLLLSRSSLRMVSPIEHLHFTSTL